MIIDTVSLGTSLSTSYFYIWYKEERSVSIPWDASSSFVKRAIEKLDNVVGDVCVSRSLSVLSGEAGGFRWAIRFEGIEDDFKGNLKTEEAAVIRQHKAIDLHLTFIVQNKPLDDWEHDDGETGMCTLRNARYVAGTKSKNLVFRFLSLPGDEAFPLLLPLPFNINSDQESKGITNAVNNGASTTINAEVGWSYGIPNNITIDTRQPQIIGIIMDSSNTFGNTLHAGDVISFTIEFNIAVTVSDESFIRIFIYTLFDLIIFSNIFVSLSILLQVVGTPVLQLPSVRNNGAHAAFDSQPSSNRAVFKYSVSEHHWSNDLNLRDASISANHIFGSSTLPVTPTNLTFPSSVLSTLPSLVADGRRPKIMAIRYADDQQDAVGLGDTMKIEVHFSSPVVLVKGIPVLIINAGSGYKEALYDTGNQTTMLLFKYVIETGDHSSTNLRVNMLCVEHGCLEGCGREGYILQLSASPLLNADLMLPPHGSGEAKVAILYQFQHADRSNFDLPLLADALSDLTLGRSIAIDTTGIPQTTVTAIRIWHEGGTVAAGEVIRILVDFSNRVHCKGIPQINLNTKSMAFYESGSGTRHLTFVIHSTLEDITDELNWVFESFDESPPINCQSSYYEKCSIVDEMKNAVNLSFMDDNGATRIDALAPSLRISSIQPKISGVRADVFEPERCTMSAGCKYTAGDSILVVVSFDLAVSVGGFPRIRLALFDNNGDNVFAVYDPDASTEFDVAFRYTVEVGDTTNVMPLTYYYEEILMHKKSSIKRKSTFPSVESGLSLPNPTNYPLRNSANNFILIEATYIPSVQRLVYGNETGSYSPGDRIVISVEFDQAVEVQGVPILLLDVGGGLTGCAFYHSGSNSKHITFEYRVEESHCSTQVDYINRYSLHVKSEAKCQNEAGSIKRASENSIIDANLILPDQGIAGSLSYYSLLSLDCRVPYISKLWSPLSSRTFSTNDVVSIMVDFSRDVVVTGSPSILLETGKVDRNAIFHSQLNSKTLEFQYIVKLGDATAHLEYWTSEGINRTSIASIDLNGGSIMVPSTNPSLHADLHINPSFGHLDGMESEVTISEGEVEYRGLKIGKRGSNYKLRLGASTENGNFEAEMTIAVGESCEFEINGDEEDRDYHDGFGTSVALKGDLLAVGAPHKKVPRAEVQVVKVFSAATEITREVQLITTSVDVDKAIRTIQQFQTFASEGESVGGHFSLWYKDSHSGYGYSAPIILPADVDESFMKQKLMENYPILGDITVSRAPNVECKCMNGWIWRVTYHDASRGTNVLATDGKDLEGQGSNVSTAEVISMTNMLGGSFKIHNQFKDVRSRNISFDATAMDMKSIIEEDLAINVYSVQAANLDSRDIPELGRRWRITFSSHEGDYGEETNVPNLVVDDFLLSGADATAWTHVGAEGKSPLSGSMSFSFRGCSFSDFISYDSSEEVLKQALESLDSINEVTVIGKRSLPVVSGHAWTVIFHSVNALTDYGWIQDPGGQSTHGNLSPLEVNSHLIGWKAKAIVEIETGSGINDMQAQWMTKDMGDDGMGAGQVSIYWNSPAGWEIEGYISASDRSAHDHFGQSLSFGDDFVVVGASTKEVDGFPEQQIVTCIDIPSSGTFTIRFRGFDSNPIPLDATLDEIEDAMQGIYGGTQKLHSIPRLTLKAEEWTDTDQGFCSKVGNGFTITFWTPDGGGTSTSAGVAGDIEMIEIDQRNLIGGNIEVAELRKGTRTLSGSSSISPVGIQSGAVYIFERRKVCNFCPYLWHETKKLTMLDCFEKPQGSEEFGWSVAVQHRTIFVGAPGFENNTGKVFEFSVDDENKWKCQETLTRSGWGEKPGDHFGYSVAVNSEDTLLVGSPGNSTSTGSVTVFRRHPISQQTLLSQQIVQTTQQVGALFGHTLSISGNEAIICAPNEAHESTDENGACFIYERNSELHQFQLKQKLIASNTKKHDRFGWSAAISGDRVLVGQLEEYKGNLGPQAPVQLITIKCGVPDCKDHISGSFSLGWRDNAFITNRIPHSISAKQLKHVLEDELDTGPVNINRTKLSDKNGGFQWSITFTSFGQHLSQEITFPKLSCDSTLLGGSMPLCIVEHFGEIHKRIRGKAHLFTSRDGSWTEQAFLFPAVPQAQDLFGGAIALDANIALVGAPNRQLLNVNSGAAIVYDLSFSNFHFDETSYNVTEGETLDIHISQHSPDQNRILGIKSLDINAENSLQYYTRALWGLPKDEQFTTIEFLTGNSALTNDQFYGGVDNRSEWVRGMFDYRGMNDYEALDHQIMVASDMETVTLKTTNDGIFEAPDERLTIQVALPGMFASPLGHLKTDITIVDDGDGMIENEPYYSKLFSSSQKSRFGSAIALLSEEKLVVIGNDSENNHRGVAHLYSFKNGKWTELVRILPPHPLLKGSNFGQSVGITRTLHSNDINILVGQPGQATVHVFGYDIASSIMLHQSELKPFDESFASSEHDFGTRGSAQISGDLVFVGSSTLETVYVYRRVYNAQTLDFTWNTWSKLRSSDFDYDIFDHGHSIKHVHKQGFGTIIVSSERQLLISAPNSNYDNRGDLGLGKGKVYVFHSSPHILKITCTLGDLPSDGTFKITIPSRDVTSTSILWNETQDGIRTKLEALIMKGQISVWLEQSFNETSRSLTQSWTFSLLNSYDDEAPEMVMLWYGNNCNECTPFSGENDTVVDVDIRIDNISSLSSFKQTNVIQGDDVTSGDCFGCAIDMDDDQVIVGAPFSSAKSRTTWDFETGNLIGWFATGNAFDFQPTYGDNCRRRMVYKGYGRDESFTSGEPQTSHVQGRYYIGTYEKRPGNTTDYVLPDDNHFEGGIQGDAPIGTLTCDPFIIQGDSISLLIGGGCNYLTEYVELLVDGFATMRATGQCKESMDLVHWDISVHKGRAAQIRIVDKSSSHWGHINVDRIQFSWNSAHVTGGAIPTTRSSREKQHYSGVEETAKSGAAYVFKRQCKDWLNTQLANECEWMQEQRLVPSDKRANNLFGTSVSLKEETAAVGSPGSPAYGFFKEDLELQVDFPVNPREEYLMKSGNILTATPGNLRLLDHLADNTTKHLPVILPTRYREKAGALYTFQKEKKNESITTWTISEQGRIAPPDVNGNDHFASVHSTAESSIVIGTDSGKGIYLFNMKWQSVRFSSIEYVAAEGNDSETKIEVVRDPCDKALYIGYSTSDLTATGVDKLKINNCMDQSLENRIGCGDYEQSSGILYFAPGQNVATFIVRIMDDGCRERHMEYVQLNLHIPGAAAIQGEQFRAQLRIDDDDWNGDLCPDGIS